MLVWWLSWCRRVPKGLVDASRHRGVEDFDPVRARLRDGVLGKSVRAERGARVKPARRDSYFPWFQGRSSVLCGTTAVGGGIHCWLLAAGARLLLDEVGWISKIHSRGAVLPRARGGRRDERNATRKPGGQHIGWIHIIVTCP